MFPGSAASAWWQQPEGVEERVGGGCSSDGGGGGLFGWLCWPDLLFGRVSCVTVRKLNQVEMLKIQ